MAHVDNNETDEEDTIRGQAPKPWEGTPHMELVRGSVDVPSSQWQVIARVWGPDPGEPIIDCSSLPPEKRAEVVSYVESELNNQMTTMVCVQMADGSRAESWLGKLR